MLTGKDIFEASRQAQDLVVPGEVDSHDALATILNKKLRGKVDTIEEQLQAANVVLQHACELIKQYMNRYGVRVAVCPLCEEALNLESQCANSKCSISEAR